MRTRKGHPIYLHKSGQWTCTRDGKQWYLGTDFQKAMQEYEARMDELQKGLAQPPLTVRSVINKWQDAKRRECDAGDITEATFDNCHQAAKALVDHFGRVRLIATIRPTDLEAFLDSLSDYAPSTRKRLIQAARSVFTWAFDHELIARPIKTKLLKAPGRKAIKKSRSARIRVLKPEECQYLLEHADATQKLCVALALNCAMGQADIAALQPEHIHGEWLVMERVKTLELRKAWLWPRTRPLLDQIPVTISADAIGLRMRRYIKKCDINSTFYSLRHTCIDTASQSGDLLAVKIVAGHSDSSITSTYLHEIDDERIRTVCELVEQRLFGKEELKVASGI